MPPALPANVAMNLLPDSPTAWDIAEPPAPAPAAISRSAKPCLARVANFMALAIGPISGLSAIAIGDDLTTALVQAGLTSLLALAVLRPFAHIAGQALARH
ncbi:MAG: hypothetical protein ACKO2G_13135 [Verrucomicrobiales bacterium]